MAPPQALQGDAFHDSSNIGPRACHSIPDGGTFSVYSSTNINAPPQVVYDAILDIGRWKEWNSFVYDVTITKHPKAHQKSLKMTEGTFMTFHVKMNDKYQTTSKETCTHIAQLKSRESRSKAPVTKIRWQLDNANLMTPRFIMKAERTNEIEEADDGTTNYRTWQVFGGMVAKTIRKRYGDDLQKRMQEWCMDLKSHAEATHAAGRDQSANSEGQLNSVTA